MEWEQLKSEIENAVGKRLDQLQSNLEVQRGRLLSTITRVQSFAELLKQKTPNGIQSATIEKKSDAIPEECPFPRSKTTKIINKTELPKPPPVEVKSANKEVKKEEIKKKEEPKPPVEDKKNQAEEVKKKKLEEAKKKKEDDEAKKKEAQVKKKEEEDKKKEEAKRKAEEVKEKKKQEEIDKKQKLEEVKKKLEEEKEKKKHEEIEKKKTEELEKKSKLEEAKKKAEEAKEKKKQEDIEKKAKAEEEKERKKKEEAGKKAKIEEEKEKKKQEELEKKTKSEEEKKKKAEEEKKKKLEDSKKKTENPKKEDPKARPGVKIDTKKSSSTFSTVKHDDGSSNTEHSSDLKPLPEDLSKINIQNSSALVQDSSRDEANTQNIEKEKPKEVTNSEEMKKEESKSLSSEDQRISQFSSIEEIKSQLNALKSSYSEEEISSEKKFELSVGAKSAISLLTTMDDDKFYLDRSPRAEVVWTFRLFFVFLNRDLPQDDGEAWKECRKFLIEARDKDKIGKTIDKFIIDTMNRFDFSDENVDKIEKMTYGKDAFLQPQYYTEFCPLTGLLMFGVREAAIYGGAVQGKVPISRRYKRLLYKQQQLENMLLS